MYDTTNNEIFKSFESKTEAAKELGILKRTQDTYIKTLYKEIYILKLG